MHAYLQTAFIAKSPQYRVTSIKCCTNYIDKIQRCSRVQRLCPQYLHGNSSFLGLISIKSLIIHWLKPMTKVTEGLCWFYNFLPLGFSAPFSGLYTCIMKNSQIKSEMLVINNHRDKGILLIWKLCLLGVTCLWPEANIHV